MYFVYFCSCQMCAGGSWKAPLAAACTPQKGPYRYLASMLQSLINSSGPSSLKVWEKCTGLYARVYKVTRISPNAFRNCCQSSYALSSSFCGCFFFFF